MNFTLYRFFFPVVVYFSGSKLQMLFLSKVIKLMMIVYKTYRSTQFDTLITFTYVFEINSNFCNLTENNAYLQFVFVCLLFVMNVSVSKR